jgi:intergrase/recombinase
MRRTAITTMLMLGMKKHVVKQISGHSNDSKSFYRYVNLVQSYMDNEMDAVFNKLADVKVES